MQLRQFPRRAWVIITVLAVILLLAACQSPIDDPYSVGQQARAIVDVLLADASEFMAGFCGEPQAAALALLAILLRFGKRAF